MQIKKHLLCTLFLNCPWVSCLHASSGTLNTMSYKLNFQRLFYGTIVKYNSLLKIIHINFKLVQKYERGCVHSRKKHAVLGLNMANLLLSIKGILQSWSCRPNHLFNYFLGHCNPASAPVQFYCEFSKWRILVEYDVKNRTLCGFDLKNLMMEVLHRLSSHLFSNF